MYVNCLRPVNRLDNLVTISNCRNMHRNDMKIILQLCCLDILFIAALSCNTDDESPVNMWRRWSLLWKDILELAVGVKSLENKSSGFGICLNSSNTFSPLQSNHLKGAIMLFYITRLDKAGSVTHSIQYSKNFKFVLLSCFIKVCSLEFAWSPYWGRILSGIRKRLNIGKSSHLSNVVLLRRKNGGKVDE